MTKKIAFALFLLILSITSILLYVTLTETHNWGGDFAAYIMQAKSLTEFSPLNFIEANRFTIEQSSTPMGPIAYPWGLPALLAPLYAIFGLNMVAFKMVGALSYILFLVSLWYGFYRVHSQIILLFFVSLFAINPTFLNFSNNIISDLPFLFLSTLSIVMIGWMIVERRYLISQFWDYVLLGFVIAAAFFVRSNGALLLVTLGFSQIISCLKKQYKKQPAKLEYGRGGISERILLSVRGISAQSLLIYLVPYTVFLLLVMVWSLILPEGGGGHASYFKRVSLYMIRDHLYYYSVLPSRFFSGIPFSNLLYVATIPFAVTGFIRNYQSTYHTIIYSMLTFFLYTLWPSKQGLRFLFPILPFYLSFVLSGLEVFLKDKDTKAMPEGWFRKLICFTPLLAIILCFGLISVNQAYDHLQVDNKISIGPFSETSERMFAFITDHTEETSTVIFRKPRVMRLMTNRKSISINKIGQIPRGDYLCLALGRKNKSHQISILEIQELEKQGLVRLVYENDNFSVYDLTP